MRQRGSRQGRRSPEKLQFKDASAPRSQAAGAPGAALTVREGHRAAGEAGTGAAGPRASVQRGQLLLHRRPRLGRQRPREGAEGAPPATPAPRRPARGPHPTVGSGRKVRAGPGGCSVWGSPTLNSSGARPQLAPQGLLFSPPGTGPAGRLTPGRVEVTASLGRGWGRVPCQPGRAPRRRQGRILGTEGRRRLGRGGGCPQCDAPTRTWFSTETKRAV